MEVTGLVAGIVPLGVLLFQACGQIYKLRQQYNGVDKTIEVYLKRIDLDYSVLKVTIDALLRRCQDPEKVRAEVLASSESGDQSILSDKMQSAFGDDFCQPVFKAIELIKETTSSIEAILSSLGLLREEEGGITHAGMGEPNITSFPRWLPRRLRRRTRFKIIAQHTMEELNQQRGVLADSARAVQTVVFLKLRETPHITSTDPDAAPSSASPTGTVSSYRPDAMARQDASRRLYPIVSGTLRLTCQCHALHLCLDDLDTLISQPVGSLQGSETPQFCFLLTSCTPTPGCPHKLPITQWPIPYFVFTAQNDDTDGSAVGTFESIYDKLQPDQLFEPCLYVQGKLTFELRRASATCTAAAKTVLSLEKLISPGSTNSRECIQLATKLVKTVLSFYDTPWISDWTLETVQCFDESRIQDNGTGTREFSAPHIAVKFCESRNIYAANQEIRALGHMLLQIGRQKQFENTMASAMAPRVALQVAMDDLHTKMGKPFKVVVDNLINKWGSSNVDIMEEQHLEAFQADIETLEGLIKMYTP